MENFTCDGVIVPEFLEGEGRSFAARRLLQVAASTASRSQSPIAVALRDFYNGAYLEVADSQDTSDGGFSAVVEGNLVTVRPNGEIYSGSSYVGAVALKPKMV